MPSTSAAPRDGQTLRLRDRPELRIDQSRLIDTGALAADRAYAWGPEFGIRWRNFLLQGEYIRIGRRNRRRARISASMAAMSRRAGCSTGEPRHYNSTSGAFGRPSPRAPFSLAEGGWGAWEVMARYSVADLNDKARRGIPAAATGGVFGGRQEVIGLGLSWYPNRLLRFMLDWDIVNVDRLDPDRHDADRPAVPHHRAQDAAGVLKTGRSRLPRSSSTSPAISMPPAPQAAQKASIGGSRPGDSASLSSSATRAQITASDAPIRLQAIRCMAMRSILIPPGPPARTQTQHPGLGGFGPVLGRFRGSGSAGAVAPRA